MAGSPEPRASIVSALAADLVGPFDPAAPDERLGIPPSRWYLTGFLAPHTARDPKDPTADDEISGTDDEDDNQSPNAEPEAKQRNFFPASMGMSVLLPPARGKDIEHVCVTVTYADYVREDTQRPDSRKKDVAWKRIPRTPPALDVALDSKSLEAGVYVPDAIGLRVCGKLEVADAPGLDTGTRALSLFIVNERPPGEPGRVDESFAFQMTLAIEYARGFVARGNRQGEALLDPDDQTADVQFRGHAEWAVGHNVAVEAPGPARPVTSLRTTWIPTCEVRRVATRLEPTVRTRMEDLAAFADGDAARRALLPMVDAYEAWIATQETIALDSKTRRETQERLVRSARRARDRIRAGIELLATNAETLEAFRWMNGAMASSALQRSPGRYSADVRPSWHLFQLAFVLLSLVGIANDEHEDRDEVELIFFPTGGGKTEAYLGVIAFTLLLRRLRGQSRPDGGLGVAVLLRYTLRLLTLDQLGRAATLICALEILRQQNVERLGTVRFAVGLWVGKSATANTMEQVKKLIIDYKNSATKNAPSPFPLTNCPWCGGPLGRESLRLAPSQAKPEEVIVACVSPAGSAPSQCAFSPRVNPEGLPVLFVDEQLYRELPCFIVATVDKFAMLPWRGETGMLFGRVSAREGRQFYGPMDREPKSSTRITGGLRPPELIVQDELHLISGPLGTMVGLYETAIDHLATRTVNGKAVRPKVIASTATVKRARAQSRALFGRKDTSLFPPPGVDAGDTWFARVDHEKAGRLYVGVAAPGRALKAILLRTYVALLASAQRAFNPQGGSAQDADAYMTLVGYFNSLRELGGMRRLVEDDVRKRAGDIERRHPVSHVGAHAWALDRAVGEPVELTSREKSGSIKEAKDRLALDHTNPAHVDVLLASNMISVGVDIDRLGLMVIAGQPKTTSEYIQASSRVGRQHPGLVVTCFNVGKPRDRSHYERFVAWHESFYRFVEAQSLTPFSGPAIERGLAGTLMAMARLGNPDLTAPDRAMTIAAHRAFADACVKALSERAKSHAVLDRDETARLANALNDRGRKLLDAWERLVVEARDSAGDRSYSRYDKDKSHGKALLYSVVDEDKPAAHSLGARFAAPTSMRDVEASVHLWIERGKLGGRR